jgi:hypothetical protein
MPKARLADSNSGDAKGQAGLNAESANGWPAAPTEGTAELLSIADIETRYGITRYLVYKWAREGRLHVIPVGKRFKYLNFEVASAVTKSYLLAAAA